MVGDAVDRSSSGHMLTFLLIPFYLYIDSRRWSPFEILISDKKFFLRLVGQNEMSQIIKYSIFIAGGALDLHFILKLTMLNLDGYL